MKKILLIRYKKSIGDTIIATTLCDNLKKKYPDSKIDFLIYENLDKLFNNHRSIDEVIVFNRKKGIKATIDIIRKIRKTKYDVVIDCRAIPFTMILTLLSGAKMRIGEYRRKYSNLCYTNPMKKYKEKSVEVEKYHTLLEPLEINEVITEYEITITTQEKEVWKEKMKEEGIDFNKLIIPMAIIARQEYKQYPLELMKEVIEKLIEKYEAQIILFYSPSEKEDVINFSKEIKQNENIFTNLETKNPRELACIFSNSDLFVGNEGGSRHIAEGVGLKNLCIVSPRTRKKEWLVNENVSNQSIDIKEVDGNSYEDIIPKYILKRIENQLKEFGYFNKFMKNKREDINENTSSKI